MLNIKGLMLGLAATWGLSTAVWAEDKVEVEPTVKEVKSSSESEFEITYEWKVTESPKADWTSYVHFTDENGEIKFQDDHEPSPETSKWKVGMVKDGPNTVSIPDGLTGTFEIRMGLYKVDGGERAELNGKGDEELRILVGKVKVADGKVVFVPNPKP
ncbi:hypothetical protein [Planctomicrobium piriforme]|uniref:Uncharacterized protein n=1 Tax=Planctomicrobium piriforme TaxID=1576369 RepID=A0A1I3LPM3_9PLAN|nr:hypothetical protein [Planctomicrobium piriforme]SFI86734.1 hypothetical protein SAMN05421753_11330 [Planctomicrobium piriforme]